MFYVVLMVAVSSSIAGYLIGYRTCQKDLVNAMSYTK